MSLEKIEAMSLQVRVYRRLKEALICGHFEPGQVLVIRDLAEQLGTSPMPIRQSLHRLVSEHALEEDDRVRSSVRVPEISKEVFEDIRAARCLVEGEAASRAAKLADESLIAKLKLHDAVMQQAVKKQEPAEIILANRDFHFEVYRAARSTALMRIIESLWLQSGPYFRTLIIRYGGDEPDPANDINAHEGIMTALCHNDSVAAAKALRNDIILAANYFVTSTEGDLQIGTGKKKLSVL